MSEHDRLSEDCGAYALGALEEPETEALRKHMATCTLCRNEVKRLQAVAEVLGLGVPALAAPPELRRRVLDVVSAEATPRRVPRRRRLSMPWGFGGGVLAAGTLALGLLLGALVLAPGGSSTTVIPASVASATRWNAARAPVASLRETGTQGELVLSRLPPAPPGKIYEVWIARRGRVEATPVLFDATAAGRATVAVPNLGHATAVLVTAERRGGATRPTMPPLVDARLS